MLINKMELEDDEKGAVKIDLKDLNDLTESHNKYKQMCGELENIFRPGRYFEISEVNIFQCGDVVRDIKAEIKAIKQKYFPEPEPVEKFISFKVEAKDKEKMDKFMRLLTLDACEIGVNLKDIDKEF